MQVTQGSPEVNQEAERTREKRGQEPSSRFPQEGTSYRVSGLGLVSVDNFSGPWAKGWSLVLWCWPCSE